MEKLNLDSTIRDLLEHLGINLNDIYNQGYSDGLADGRDQIRETKAKKKEEDKDPSEDADGDEEEIDYYGLGFSHGEHDCKNNLCYDGIYYDNDEYSRGYKDGWNQYFKNNYTFYNEDE